MNWGRREHKYRWFVTEPAKASQENTSSGLFVRDYFQEALKTIHKGRMEKKLSEGYFQSPASSWSSFHISR